MLFFIAVEDDIQKQPFANVLQNSRSQKNFTRKHLRWNNKVIKKRLQLRFFPMNIAKFLRTAFFRSSHQRCSFRKVVLRNFAKFTGKHLCQSFFFNKVAGLLEKKLAQVSSVKFCEISKNISFTEHLWTTASIFYRTHPVAVSGHLNYYLIISSCYVHQQL